MVSNDSEKRKGWRQWLGFVPVRHERWELVLMRLGVAWVTWMTLKYMPLPFHAQPVPHGLAAWGIDFTWMADASVTKPLWWICMISLGLYVVGIPSALTLLAPLVTVVAQGILSNSQGAIHHTSQIIAVTLLAGWLAGMVALLMKARGRRLPHGFTPGQMEMDWIRQMLMAGYVVSAIVKLVNSNGDWFSTTPYFGLQIEKSTGMAYHAFLEMPKNAAWLAQFYIDHPLIAQITIGVGLPLELFAFMALFNRRMALLFGVGLYLFHTIVSMIMGLGFAYNRWLLLILFINPLWWLKELLRWIFSRFGSGSKGNEDPQTANA